MYGRRPPPLQKVVAFLVLAEPQHQARDHGPQDQSIILSRQPTQFQQQLKLCVDRVWSVETAHHPSQRHLSTHVISSLWDGKEFAIRVHIPYEISQPLGFLGHFLNAFGDKSAVCAVARVVCDLMFPRTVMNHLASLANEEVRPLLATEVAEGLTWESLELAASLHRRCSGLLVPVGRMNSSLWYTDATRIESGKKAALLCVIDGRSEQDLRMVMCEL